MPSYARAAEVSAESAVLYDPLTEKIIWEKDPHRQMPMASTTKIMTAYTALKLYEPEENICIKPMWTGIEGSSMYLKSGEEMNIYELICGLMLMSGNDAAEAVAGLFTGNRDDFVELMNVNAQKLGMNNTSFENPSGLDGEKHYSTAYDMALLAASALENDIFRDIVSSVSLDAAGRQMTNHNKLLSMYPGVIGVKTGYTKKAGRCLVSAAERAGRQLVCVTLSAPDDWNDHIGLYNMAYDSLTEKEMVSSGTVCKTEIVSGESGFCRLYTDEGYTASVFQDEKTEIIIYGPRFVYAPVCAGERYGKIAVEVDGCEVWSSDLYYEKDIEAETPVSQNEGFWKMIGKKIFRM